MAKAYNQFKHESDRNVIPIANNFTTQDATGTPQTSPLSYSNSVITIAVPEDAAEMVLFPTTDLRVSEIVAASRYDVIQANTKEIVACANMDSIYIVRDSADGSLRFRFLHV